MRSALFLMSVAAVIALAFWAYRENHNTRQAMIENNALNRDIAALTEAISVQRAEWAYLNRPQRLQELVALNFERLSLMPMSADQFGAIGQIAYPLPEADLSEVIDAGIDVFGDIEFLSETGRTSASEQQP
ncbi:cell division protein FtsL [Rhodobacteraceae bacterium 2376]|uniref:Cell division protein FtsL n=1 Tax=Rhabdonatronobacter sediminivivens TaxID=2743469 RepID=A0A7Z0HXV1_9RHOB|nr:cell division protein FtsL [Rhabdonatronobacter sediminivivens]NYS24237.1 cell division protein FtsL [Rhabdonatronobacter sediminivivens]